MQLAKCTWNGKTVNSGWVTTFSKRTIVSEDRVTPTPKGTSFELAALMGCAVTTALGLINKDAKLKIGQSIAVFGCGAVGLNVVQVATIVSANPIIAVDIRDSKLGFARKLGATRTLNPRPLTCAGGIGKVEVVVENTGNVKMAGLAYGLTVPQGRTIDRSPVLQRHTQERGSTEVNYE